MFKIKDSIIGKKFNKLTVLEPSSKRDSSGSVLYKCLCCCGNVTYASARHLRNGHKKSCGCLQKEKSSEARIDLTGKKFGRLTAIKYIKTVNSKAVWLCKCECGNEIEVIAESLYNGNTKSCGCLQKEQLEKERKKNFIDSTNISSIKNIYRDSSSKITKSGVKGVCWDNQKSKWRAYIMFQRVSHSLGYFNKIEDAVKARKVAEEKYFKPVLDKYKRQ